MARLMDPLADRLPGGDEQEQQERGEHEPAALRHALPHAERAARDARSRRFPRRKEPTAAAAGRPIHPSTGGASIHPLAQ
eukprot:857865-Pyramimonas_sp.AAC.3